MKYFKKTLISVAVVVALASCAATESTIKPMVDEYCKLSPESRALSRALTNTRLHPNRVEITCASEGKE